MTGNSFSKLNLDWLFRQLNNAYGDQNWWPAQGRFEMMVGAILVQNTAWTNVEKAIANLIRHGWLNLHKLHQIEEQRLAEAIRASGTFTAKARRLKALCVWLVERGGIEALDEIATEQLRRDLLTIHGVGPETADCILVYAFARPVFVVDAYTRRVLIRLGWLKTTPGYEALRAVFERTRPQDAAHLGQYHALIVEHAKQHCRARPVCTGCALRSRCDYARKPAV